MASEFKELNNQFLKRPAVALFKKPLATNDEMTNILEGLLDMDATLEQKSITEFSCGDYKAVYWNHFTKKPTYDHYGRAVVFYKVRKDDRSQVFKDLQDTYSYLDGLVCRQDQEYLDNPCNQDPYFGTSFRTITDELNFSSSSKNVLGQEQINSIITNDSSFNEKYRTYTLWIIDPYFTTPENNSEVAKTEKAEEFWYPLNNEVFESDVLKPLYGNDEFAETEEGKKIIEEANKRGIKPLDIKKYVFKIKEDVAIKELTKTDLDTAIGLFKEDVGAQTWFFYSKMIQSYKDFIYNELKSSIRQPLCSIEEQSKDKVPIFLYPVKTVRTGFTFGEHTGVKHDLYTSYMAFPISKFFRVNYFLTKDNNYLKFSYPENPNLDDLVPEPKNTYYLPCSKNSQYQYVYDRNSNEFRVEYMQSVLKVPPKFENLLLEDVVEAYIAICNRVNCEVNRVKHTQENSLLLDTLGYDTPLRTSTETQTYFKNNSSGYAQQFIESKVLENLRVVVEGGSSKSSTRTIVSHSVNQKDVPTIFNFKFNYYSKIYYNYIRPKYVKYKKFIDSGLMKMYPQGFISRVDKDLKAYEKNSLSTSNKLKFLDYFEESVFNKVNGFYITSTTDNPETIAPYSNTIIMNDNVDSTAENILSTLNTLSTSKNSNFAGINNLNNKDVSSISVSRQARGKSSSSVILKNLNNKYTIKDGIYKGDIILEPMDEILIYFPTFNEKLNLSFKGFIDSVQVINNKGYNSVGIQASCPIKKLELTRTNVKPSLSAAENLNSEIHPFTVPKDFFNNISKWAPFMFMQALTFYSSQLKKSSIEDNTTNIYTLDDNRMPTFKDTLLQYLWYKKTNADYSQQVSASALQALTNLYTSSVVQSNKKRATMDTETTGIKNPLEVYQGSFKNGSDSLKIYYNVYAQRNDSVIRPKYRQLEAQILGTSQPSWVIGQQDISIIFSDYRTNYDILSETAEKFNCYLYSNRNGIVQFRSPQIDLLGLNRDKFNLSNSRILIEQDHMYEMRPDILGAQTTTSVQAECNDSILITWLQISGENVWGGLDAGAGNAVVVQDLPKSLKYGIKSQQVQMLCGVTKKTALVMYALSLMDRQNSQFRSAKITGLASGDMDVNYTVFSPTNNTVYLLDGITFSYVPGQTFTYSASLKWGRKPLFKVPLKGKTLSSIDLTALSNSLLSLVKNNEITPAYYYQLKSYIDYVKTNPESVNILASFIFNGYVWDGVSSISFEDLILTYSGEISAENNGLELALGLNAKQLTEEERKELEEKSKNLMLEQVELFSTLIRNTVINGADVQKNIEIYTSKKSF